MTWPFDNDEPEPSRVCWLVTTFGPLDDEETELSRIEFDDEMNARVVYDRACEHALKHGGGVKLIRDGVVVVKFSQRARND